MSVLARGITNRLDASSALATARRRVADGVVAGTAWLRARTPEQWLWVFLALVVVAYLAVLFTASTSTGRGGR